MKHFLLGMALLAASPAFGQSSLAELAAKVVPAGTVLTNADLKPEPARSPLPIQRPVVRPEAIYEHYLERVRAREQQRGPLVVVFGSPTAGPFGEFAPFPEPRRLDGTLLSDPPWSVTTYLGHGRTSGFRPGPARPPDRPADLRDAHRPVTR